MQYSKSMQYSKLNEVAKVRNPWFKTGERDVKNTGYRNGKKWLWGLRQNQVTVVNIKIDNL